MLEDAIHVEELGVTKLANECAEHPTSFPSILRDQVATLHWKDPAIATLRHCLELGREPKRERKQETQEALQLESYLVYITEEDSAQQ